MIHQSDLSRQWGGGLLRQLIWCLNTSFLNLRRLFLMDGVHRGNSRGDTVIKIKEMIIINK